MINLSAMKEADRASVLALQVADDQTQYVGTTRDILCELTNNEHPHVIKQSGRVVGFFLIDVAYGDRYDFCPAGVLGLRAFLIDQACQGQGVGKQSVAQLKAYLNQYYSDYSNIYLTVNCKNPAAYRCYVAAGFSDNNDLYHGGLAGPQHILKMSLIDE